MTKCDTYHDDLRFLQVLFDENTQQYSIVTIHKEVPIEEEEEGVAFATEI